MSELTEMTKLVRRIAIATEKLAAATERRSADSTAPAPEAKCGEETECECDNTHDQNDTVCRYCWAKGRRRPSDPTPEAKCGEAICCDDPDCAERENKEEAISIAKRIYAHGADIDINDDAAVDLVLDTEGNVTAAWVAAHVYVTFEANKGGK